MTTTPNTAKYNSYKLAHERISAAMEAGFPLEVVTIVESIITDRLRSFANHHGAGLTVNVTLGRVVQKVCEKYASSDQAASGLARRAADWARRRNQVLHGIAKSEQGVGPMIPAESFVKEAYLVAEEGIALMKDIKKWHGGLVREARSARDA